MREKKPLDTVVKMGLGVLIGSFALIWGGMYLTRPDRSIPPYSIGSQEDAAVAMHVPVYTSDAGLETLIQRFQKVAQESRDFGKMKIRPTTPADPQGRYQRLTIYIFTHDSWAEPDMLHRYLTAGGSPADRELRETFEKAVRGYYRLDGTDEEGRIGPLFGVLGKEATPATAAYARLLFKGPVASRVSDARPGPLPSPPSGGPAIRDP
jgi:hypothetical protein